MEHPIKRMAWRPLLALVICSLFNLMVMAQESGDGGDGGSSTTTTKKTSVSISSSDSGSTWYTSPWVWIVGAAVFILLLVALLSNRGRDTVHVTKTVERDHGHGS